MASAHDFVFAPLTGDGDVDLGAFPDAALLIVNVASACGYTSQYRELQSLYDAKRPKGLVVIGVPCNEFGAQEPGEAAEIRAFCDDAYGVSFPMTEKVEIIGPGRHPFYQWIATEAGEGALPRWNFHKYLIGKDGALRDSFPSAANPLGPEMIAAIDKALNA